MRHAAHILMGLLLLLPATPLFAGTALADDDGSGAEDDDRPRAKRKARSKKAKPRVSPRKPIPPSDAAKSSDKKPKSSKGKAADKTASDEEENTTPWSGDPDTPPSADSAADKKPPKKKSSPIPKDVRININYEEVEIKDIIKDFAHKTGRNFLVASGVSGKITIHAPRAVSIDEAYEAFIVALDSVGFTTVVEARFKTGSNRGKPMLTRIMPAVPVTPRTITGTQMCFMRSPTLAQVHSGWPANSGENKPAMLMPK